MSTVLKFRRGDTTASNAFTGAEGELFVDTTKDTLVVHDGVTAGGKPLATESYVSSAISTKVDSSSLATVATSGSYNDLTDKPSIPSLTGYATESYVTTQITNLIDSAPSALDTLNELAAALGDDSNYAATITTALSGKQATLVSASNIKTINGNSILGAGDLVLAIPTKTSNLTNDSGFITSSALTGYATESYVGTQISNLIDAAPAALDTLNELAAALGDDANYATTVTNALSAKANSSDVTYVGTTQVALNRSSGTQALTGITSIAFGNSIITDGTVSIATASSNNVLDSFVASDYRTAKYVIQAISGSDVYATELILMHDDTTVYVTEYATVYTTSSLISITANIVSGLLEVYITTANNDTTVDFTRTTIAARTLGAATVAGDMMTLSGTEDLLTGTGSEDLNA